jgi:hypothetical protein
LCEKEFAMLGCQWTLHKDGETFVFRCRVGDEGQLLAEIADQVAGGRIALDPADIVGLVRTITDGIPPGDSALMAMIRMDQEAASQSLAW